MWTKFYLIFGIAVIGLYGLMSLTGREFGNPERRVAPADARQSPGGYRSFYFWHAGYQGGK